MSFEQAISTGYATDGGLYVPEQLPRVDSAELEQLAVLSFPELAEAIFRKFISAEEVADAELHRIVQACYKDFTADEIVPVKQLGGAYISELFHGPTYCFKDLGQQPLIRLLAYFADRSKKNRTMLVATTGDTGPAALKAVGDAQSPYLKMITFFPEGQISQLQRMQMTTVHSPSARCITFQGGGDDMDTPIKNMSMDKDFATRHGLCGVNSYNFCRPLAQTIHYYWTYFQVMKQAGLPVGSKLDIVIPTGAMGNITAGYICKQMGLPLGRLVAGVNINDITHRAISRGEFHKAPEMLRCMSEAINIQVPYNFERVVYYLTSENQELVKSWMTTMDATSKLTLPSEWLLKLQQDFSSARIEDSTMLQATRDAYERFDYLACPHTAVAIAAATHLGMFPSPPQGAPPVAIMATAHPCKFEEVVVAAVGKEAWDVFAATPAKFPKDAIEIVRRPEQVPTVLVRSAEGFEATLVKWETAVRGLLDMQDLKASL